MEEFSKEKNPSDTDNSMVITRGKGSGRGQKRVNGGQMVMEGDLIWGGEHTIQYTDDVL